MLDNVYVNTQSSIKIKGSQVIYIDPYKIDKSTNDSDIIFITHSHYDHYSPDDIEKVRKSDTVIVVPNYMESDVSKYFDKDKIILVTPNNSYSALNLNFNTTYSYNVDKTFHPKSNNNVGYVIDLDNIKYFITGDTDNILEIRNIKCDVLFLPIGGVYTMNVDEAVSLTKEIKPSFVVPTHYGSIVGSVNDGIDFKNKIEENNIKCIIYIK